VLTPILATEDPYRAAAIFCRAGWQLEFETPPDSGDPLACVSLAGSKVLLGTSEPQFLAPEARPFRGAGVEFHVDVPWGEIEAIHLTIGPWTRRRARSRTGRGGSVPSTSRWAVTDS
jgi:hypothetical protein